jgi:hypothetical protein
MVLAYTEGMSIEQHNPTSSLKRPSIDSIDVENKAELELLDAYVLKAGSAIAPAARKEMIRKGVIDTRGSLPVTSILNTQRDGVTKGVQTITVGPNCG